MEQTILKSKNWLLTAEYWITKVCKWFSYVSAACAALTMLISVSDVIGVEIFGWSIPSSVEYIEELMVFSVFFAIAYVQLERGHISVNILEKYTPKTLRYYFLLFGYITGILVIGFLSWRAFTLLHYSILNQLVKTGTVKYPLWPSHLAVFLGFTCLTVTLILLFCRDLISKKDN